MRGTAEAPTRRDVRRDGKFPSQTPHTARYRATPTTYTPTT